MRTMNKYQLTNYNIVTALSGLLLSFTCYGSSLESLKVTFFDVGQGNGTLVTCGSCPPLLVDCGSSSYSYRGTQFPERQISKITEALKACTSPTFFLVVSHPDGDHYNWLPEILSEAEKNGRSVGNAWLGGIEGHYGSTKELISTLKGNLGTDYASKVNFPTAGGPTSASISIFNMPELSYTILPALSCGANKTKESNESSLVVQVLYHGKAILLTGDATAKTFRHIGASLPKNVLVMLASHHGAEPSENKNKADACNDQDLIKATEPFIVIFSSGRRRDYIHPRLKAVTSYALTQKTLGYTVNWHTLFCGMPSLSEAAGQPPFLSLSDNYVVILTERPIFSTLTHGTITCTIKPEQDGGAAVEQIEMDNPAIYDSARKAALLFPLFETAGAFSHSEISAIRLGKLEIDDTDEDDAKLLIDLLEVLKTKCPKLKTLILSNNRLASDTTFNYLVSLLETIDVRDVEIEGSEIELSEETTEKLVDAWNLRGLKLQPPVESSDEEKD